MVPKRCSGAQREEQKSKRRKGSFGEERKCSHGQGGCAHVVKPAVKRKPLHSTALNTRGSDVSLIYFLKDAPWKKALKAEAEKDYFKVIESFLKEEYRNGNVIYPQREQIFNALNKTTLGQVKVVMIGEEPYHEEGQAHGLSFSCNHYASISSELRNILCQLEQEIPGFKVPDCGNLEKWAMRGVLLLNTILTVEAGKPKSHANIGWQTFTDAIVQAISDTQSGVVFLLLHGFSQKEKLVDTEKHCVIKAAIPHSKDDFSACTCFTEANDKLAEMGRTPVNWKLWLSRASNPSACSTNTYFTIYYDTGIFCIFSIFLMKDWEMSIMLISVYESCFIIRQTR